MYFFIRLYCEILIKLFAKTSTVSVSICGEKKNENRNFINKIPEAVILGYSVLLQCIFYRNQAGYIYSTDTGI